MATVEPLEGSKILQPFRYGIRFLINIYLFILVANVSVRC